MKTHFTVVETSTDSRQEKVTTLTNNQENENLSNNKIPLYSHQIEKYYRKDLSLLGFPLKWIQDQDLLQVYLEQELRGWQNETKERKLIKGVTFVIRITPVGSGVSIPSEPPGKWRDYLPELSYSKKWGRSINQWRVSPAFPSCSYTQGQVNKTLIIIQGIKEPREESEDTADTCS